MIIEGLAGGILGLVGSLFNKGFSFLEKKQDLQAKAMEYEQERKLLDMELKQRSRDIEHEEHMHESQMESDMYSKSIEHDISSGDTSQWVNNTLRLVRPSLTLILVLLTGLIYISSIGTPNADNIVSSVITMTATAVAWWFGDRGVSKSGKLPWLN